MLIRFNYEKAEVIAALRYHFLHKGEIRIFGITLIVLLLFAVIGYQTGLVTFAAMVSVLVMMLLLILAFWYLLPQSVYHRTATFRDTIDLRFDEEAMFIGTRSGERRITWKQFHRTAQAGAFIFLYRNNQSFFLVPIRAFKSETDRHEFTRMLETKIY
jgi:uncharacterized membrane protein YfcA